MKSNSNQSTEFDSGQQRSPEDGHLAGLTRALPLIIPLLMIGIWETSVRTGWWPQSLIASPSQVAGDFLHLLGTGTLLLHAYVSIRRLFLGFLTGSATGVFVGSLVGFSKLCEQLFAPTIQLLAPVPPVAWIPLLIIIFGIGEGSKIVLIASGAFFVVFIHTVQGIRSTDQNLVDVAYLYEKTTFQLVFLVLLPSATTSIMTGMRLSLGLSWILLIAAEVIASQEGLGWLIWDSRNFSRPDDMVVGMIMVGILGKLSDQALVAVERHLLVWRRAFEGK